MILKNVSATAVLRRDVDMSGAVKEDCIVHKNTALVWMREAGDAVQRKRFSRAAWPKQHRNTRTSPEVNVQLKGLGITSSRETLDQARVYDARVRIRQAALLRREVRET